jgi:hypothetical protein
MIPMIDLAKEIHTKNDLIAFIYVLIEDYNTNSSSTWENNTVPSFLTGILGFIHDYEGFYLNSGEVPPPNMTWRLMAETLVAARTYE